MTQPSLDPALTERERAALLALAGEHVLEFGTGGSTIMLLHHGHHVTSVESDGMWVRRVLKQAGEFEDRLDMRYVDIGPIGQYGAPRRADAGWRWPDYWSAGDDTMPGLVFVDGRFRVACALNAALHWDVPIAVHDFSRRRGYWSLEAHLQRAAQAGSLAVFRRRPDTENEALALALAHYAADFR